MHLTFNSAMYGAPKPFFCYFVHFLFVHMYTHLTSLDTNVISFSTPSSPFVFCSLGSSDKICAQTSN